MVMVMNHVNSGTILALAIYGYPAEYTCVVIALQYRGNICIIIL